MDFYLLPFVKPGYVRKLFDEEIKGYDMAVRRLIEREEIDPARRCVILSHQFYTAAERSLRPVTPKSTMSVALKMSMPACLRRSTMLHWDISTAHSI